MDNTALFKVGYGLYVLTARYDNKDNGCIINTVLQVTSAPPFVGVITLNKQNFTHDLIVKSGEFNVSILTTEVSFEVFKRFGFQSGKTVDKFKDYENISRSENGLIYLTEGANSYLSFKVIDTIDFDSHTMFKCDIVDGKNLNDVESVTYAFYQENIKPKPQQKKKQCYQCRICGYIYEGDSLPEDFICPICKHGSGDFEKI